MTEEKKKQIESFKQDLIKLSKGQSIGSFTKTNSKTITTAS
jgi:hypothetical protein